MHGYHRDSVPHPCFMETKMGYRLQNGTSGSACHGIVKRSVGEKAAEMISVADQKLAWRP